MAKSMEELMELIDKMPDEKAKAGEFILPELMAIAIAHEVLNDDVVFAGTGLPMVGIMAANMLNAPNAVLIYESGICDGKTMHVPMSVSDQRAANMCSTLGGLVDTFGYYLQQGFVTLGFLAGMVVSMVHTESPSRIHVISFRKATRNEEAILFKKLQD